MPPAAPSRKAQSRKAHRPAMARKVLPVATACLLALTLFPQAAEAGGGPSYVALGDSYTAGPLIPAQTGSPLACLRSTNDYPALTAAAVGASSFTNISCSGATPGDMTGSQSVTGGTNPPQFSALSSSTKLVTMGIG